MQNSRHVFLFYSRDIGEYERHIRQVAEEACGCAETFRSVQSLQARLKLSLHDIIGIVLVIGDEREFDTIAGLEDLMSDIPVYIALNSRDMRLVQKCHRLHPRMVEIAGDRGAAESVLKSMYRRHLEESGVARN
jgi:hypothetical protein